MSNLLASLSSSTGASSIFQRGLEVIQNNVSNASTPGYARQRQALEAAPFEPEGGLPGGVRAGQLVSARDEYAEQGVRRRQERFGRFDQLQTSLSQIEPDLDATGQAGVPAALNKLFQSFSALSVNPNDAVARRAVIDRARDLSVSVVRTGTALENASTDASTRLEGSVATVNRLAGLLRGYNADIRSGGLSAKDPALDTNIHNALEELSGSIDFQTVKQSDGTLTVLAGGQVPLVIGDRQLSLETDLSGASAKVLDSSGKDVTAQLTGGRLGAVLQVKNQSVPNLLSDLNRLAAGVADKVNTILAAGVDANNQPGKPLFSYNTASDAALTLAVAPLTTQDLAVAAPSSPGGNANALGTRRSRDLSATRRIYLHQLLRKHIRKARTRAIRRQDQFADRAAIAGSSPRAPQRVFGSLPR